MGLFGNLFKGTTGSSSGNAFQGGVHMDSEKALRDYLNRSAQAGSNEFLSDPVLGKLYQSQLSDIDDQGNYIGGLKGEEADLLKKGFGLESQDRTAYGQASGDIARMFGESENNLAQALRARGLSSSPMAGRAFSNSLGNKNEQLAKIQYQIADNAFQRQVQRLNQTRDYLSQNMGLKQNMQGQAQGFSLQGIGQKDQLAANKGQLGMQGLENLQKQADTNYAQQLATAKSSPFSRTMGSVVQSMGAQLGPVGGAWGGGAAEGIFGSSSSSPEYGAMQGAAFQDSGMNLASSLMGGKGGSNTSGTYGQDPNSSNAGPYGTSGYFSGGYKPGYGKKTS